MFGPEHGEFWTHFHDEDFGLDFLALALCEKEVLAQSVSFLVEGTNDHSNKQVHDEEGDQEVEGHIKHRTLHRILLISRHLLRPFCIHSPKHHDSPVDRLGHDIHLHQCVYRVIKVMMVSIPVAPVIDTVLLGYDE